MEKKRFNIRRALLFGAGAAAIGVVWFGAPKVKSLLFPPEFYFESIKTLPEFRRLSAGSFSGNLSPLSGIGGANAASRQAEIDDLRQNLCETLFETATVVPPVVPIAYFFDYRCPYCRILSPILEDIATEYPDSVKIAWHDWPLLGGVSETGARAALAAKRQGVYLPVHQRLMRSAFVPTDAYLKEMSGGLGLDPDKLLVDARSAGVEAEIAKNKALTALFGFPGTPALVVGRTAVIGAISEYDLRALIELERDEGPPAIC